MSAYEYNDKARVVLMMKIEDILTRTKSFEQLFIDPRTLRVDGSVEARHVYVRLRGHSHRVRQFERQVADGPPADAWDQYSELLGEHRRLIGDCYDYVVASTVRLSGWDDELYRVSGYLLSELSLNAGVHWNGILSISPTDAYAPTGEVIHIRFPGCDLWNLPACAHEFGHFLVTNITSREGDGRLRQPVRELLSLQQSLSDIKWAHLEELFCDIYATYVLGPAFPIMCYALRFNPAQGHGTSHPAHVDRFAVQIGLLRRFASQETGSVTRSILETLTEGWNALMEEQGVTEGHIDALYVEECVKAFCDQLDAYLMPAARYESIAEAMGLVAMWRRTGEAPSAGSFTIRDVLNAMWLFRLQKPDDAGLLSTIYTSSMRLCMTTACG
jgi:hypothetical protein